MMMMMMMMIFKRTSTTITNSQSSITDNLTCQSEITNLTLNSNKTQGQLLCTLDIHKNILRFQISMYRAFTMKISHSRTYLKTYSKHKIDFENTRTLLQKISQRRCHELHHKKPSRHTFRCERRSHADTVHRHNERMMKSFQNCNFLTKIRQILTVTHK